MISTTSRRASCVLLFALAGLVCCATSCAQQSGSRKNPPVVSAPPAPAQPPLTQVPDSKPLPTRLVPDEVETQIIAGFKKFYVERAAKAPSIVLVFKTGSLGLNMPSADGWSRITRAEVEPYLTKPLRRSGAVVYDQASAQGEIFLEVEISKRMVPYYAPEGNSTNEIPDIQLMARQASDMAIIGQSSTFELLGTTKAWSTYRRIGEQELLRATVLRLMEDMIINSSQSATRNQTSASKDSTIKEWQQKIVMTWNDYVQKGAGQAKPALPLATQKLALDLEDYVYNASRPLAPKLTEWGVKFAERVSGSAAN